MKSVKKNGRIPLPACIFIFYYFCYFYDDNDDSELSRRTEHSLFRRI